MAVVAGKPIHATLVVVNRGRIPVDLFTGCRPKYAVALDNPTYTPRVAFPATCDLRSFTIPPGTTKLPVRIETTYLRCTSSPGAGRPTTTPACSASGSGPPGLPAGHYRTGLFGTGLALPQPHPVAVTVRPGR